MTEKKSSSATMATSSSNSGSRVPNSVNVDSSSDWDNVKAPTASQKLVKKSKEAPFVPIGV